ncbi:MAG: hydroxyacid dehydrogenase [Chloroflexi bacterium]|nr:MAG: hydroxyacid dehydrogenase [Chloroflexota bacterium]
MPPTVVIAYPGFGDISVESHLLQAAGLEVVHTQTTTTPAAQAAMRQADAVMVTIQPVSAEMIAGMERCRIISRVGTGLDAIDIPAAAARGIWVTYVPDYSIDEVSTHAITLLLAQARGLAPLLDSTRRGEWDQRPAGVVQRLSDQTLGVVGFGRIGQAAAAKGRGLGLRVIAHDDYVPENIFAAAGVERVDLATLLAESDYISLHAPLTDATRRLINARTLAQMKPSAYLINTARGPLVDEEALLAAVRGGQIAGAALDVLATEPPAPDHPLLHEPRILITPHIAWYSEAAKHDVRVRGAEEVIRVLQGQPPRAPVNQVAVTR